MKKPLLITKMEKEAPNHTNSAFLALYGRMVDRSKVNVFGNQELGTLASLMTRSEFIQHYQEYLAHTFRGSIMNTSSMEMALRDHAELFCPEGKVK